MKFRSRKMHFYYTFGLFMIYLLSRSYSMPSPETDDDDNLWRKWSDGDDDYYYDEDNNETLNNTANNINNHLNNNTSNNQYKISNNNNDSSTEITSTTHTSIIDNIPHLTNLLNIVGITRDSKSIDEEKCPDNCICSENYYFINCSNSQLENIPNNIPSQAIQIDLSHNIIETLKENDLQKLILIKDINLEHNKITNIDKETFSGLKYLDTINLAYNKLNEINPNTFTDINYLTNLDLSNNPLKLPKNGSFLNQPNLQSLNIKNIGVTEIFQDTFSNLSGLTSLNMDQNNFNKKINIKAFEPMKNLVKLKLPELERNTITDLCQVLTSIDNIALKYFDVSCYELAAGSSFNDSLILRNGSDYLGIFNLPDEEENVPIVKNNTNLQLSIKKMNNTNNIISNITLNNNTITDNDTDENINLDLENEESSYMVAISSQTINYILFGIIIIAVLGLMIGIICRKDYFGIKTKMCRRKKTRRPTSTDQIRPAEEIPLNKV